MSNEPSVRRATTADAADFARLLYDFNTEFGDPTPEPALLAERTVRMLERGETVILLGGPGPDGLAQLRFHATLYSEHIDAYLQELYVAPAQRGQGLGRALLEASIQAAREEGAAHMELVTGEDDAAARALYESAGFSNLERPPDGTRMLFYERDL